MTLRWLSREGRPPAPVRVTGTPLAVRVAGVPGMTAEEMPPRPQLRRPDSSLPPVTGGQPMAVYGERCPEDDPCGAPPITAKKAAMRTGRGT